MKKQQFEVEIKTLVGNKKAAAGILQKLKKDTSFKFKRAGKQLNHYFVKGNFAKLTEKIEKLLQKEEIEMLNEVIKNGKKHSVRTRKADEDVIFVIKASADETTSSNGTARREFEAKLQNVSLDQLDQILLDAEFEYQAKWSREREEYYYKDYVVAIDKNAGYGYLAEFEKVVEDSSQLEQTKQQIRDELSQLGLQELNQDRLARMFEHYNKNWPEYYGTEKTFVIE